MMKHWIGRRVVVVCNDKFHTKLKGTLRKWDEANRCAVIGPHDSILPFKEISTIQPLDEKSHPQSSLHSVGYVMNSLQQFDNAIYFKSGVSIWKGNDLIAYRAVIQSQDERMVTLTDGRKLRKEDCIFVVRSLRGGS